MDVHDHRPEDTAHLPPTPGLAELEGMLDGDEAEIAAGRTTPAAPVMAAARETAERIRRDRELGQAAHRRT